MAKKHYKKYSKSKSHKSKSKYRPKSKAKFKKPKRRRKNWHILEISLIAAIALSFLRYWLNLGYLIGISTIFWTVFMLTLYLRLLKRINRLDLRDDLNLWALRIVGGLMIGVGVFFGVFMASVSAVFGEPFTLGLSILVIGLIIPGAFALFRSARRYPIVHIGFLKD